MAGLSNILLTARDALSAQAFALDVTGQNINNANTSMYTRRSALIQTTNLAGQTTGGVQAVGIKRAVDKYADQQLYLSQSSSSAAGEYDSQLGQLEELFSTSSASNVGTSLDKLFSSFQALASQPSDSTVRTQVLDNAGAFVSQVNQVASAISTQKSDMLDQAKALAAQTNQRSEEIAKLNQQIVIAKQSGQDASDLIDQRNLKLLDLAQVIDFHIVEGDNGSIMVQSSGTALVDGGQTRTLSVDTDTDGKLRINAAGINGSPSADITAFVTSGKLGAVRQARDTDVFNLSSRFDQFVFDTATAINTQHAAGFGLDGSSGRNIFDVGSSAPDTARTITVSADVLGQPNTIAAAASGDELPGGSGNAVILGKLSQMQVIWSSTRTPTEAYSDIVGDIGVKKSSAESEASIQEDVFNQAKTARESVSGVSLDEEMVSLTRYQRAYQAASKMVTTVDEMMQTLLGTVNP